jgi:hypothetical protein
LKKAILLLLVSLLTSSSIWAENATLDFQLYNRTQVNIKKIYISPSNANEWEEDLLTGRMLVNGGDVTIEFHPDANETSWDIRVEDSDGGALEFEDLDLSSTNQVILNADHTATIK